MIEHVSTRPKHLRILEAFDAILAARALHVHTSVLASPFLQELRDWRVGGKSRDDALDAVSGCLLVEPIGLRLTDSVSMPPNPAQPHSWQGFDCLQAETDFHVMEEL